MHIVVCHMHVVVYSMHATSFVYKTHLMWNAIGGCGHVEIQMSQCWAFCVNHALLVNDGLEGMQLGPCLLLAPRLDTSL